MASMDQQDPLWHSTQTSASSRVRRLITWPMLVLTAALLCVLALIIVGLRVLFPVPVPVDPGAASFSGNTSGEAIEASRFRELLTDAIGHFDASVAESGGVTVALTSQAFTPGRNSLIVAQYDASGNHLISAVDILPEPAPVRLSRDGKAYLNTSNPFAANTASVAKIRDSNFVGEWALGDAGNADLPSLPEVARALGDIVGTVTVSKSVDGNMTVATSDVGTIPGAAIPGGILPEGIAAGARVSYLFDSRNRLVGVTATSPKAREGDEQAPQISYSVSTDGFAAVDLPTPTAEGSAPPSDLPSTGAWSRLVVLALDIQRAAREAALDIGEWPGGYSPEMTAEILAQPEIASRMSSAQAQFDPEESLLRDSQGRIVCLPLGDFPTSDPDKWVATPQLYLDLCPTASQSITNSAAS